jgi:hypothetical protein
MQLLNKRSAGGSEGRAIPGRAPRTPIGAPKGRAGRAGRGAPDGGPAGGSAGPWARARRAAARGQRRAAPAGARAQDPAPPPAPPRTDAAPASARPAAALRAPAARRRNAVRVAAKKTLPSDRTTVKSGAAPGGDDAGATRWARRPGVAWQRRRAHAATLPWGLVGARMAWRSRASAAPAPRQHRTGGCSGQLHCGLHPSRAR